MSPLTAVLFVAGAALLIAGAELLVRGASRLALAAGISPLVIGLTVVACGTSSPELAVSLQAALGGRADIALGNVVGSNIFNVLFILGASAMIAPLAVSRQLVRLDVPLMIGVSALLLLLAKDGRIGRPEGLALVVGAAAYAALSIHIGRKDSRGERPPAAPAGRTGAWRWIAHVVLVAAGLGLLLLGSRWLVQAAVEIAREWGLSELIIGLTIVAAGTSLPEAATSILAALRGERDIAVGNAVGSNVFNILAVLGMSALASPAGITASPAALRFDIPVMLAAAAACLPVFFTGHVIARWEGALLFGYYAAYTAYLILDASGHDALPVFSGAMLLFVLPLTVVTLMVVVARGVRKGDRPGGEAPQPGRGGENR